MYVTTVLRLQPHVSFPANDGGESAIHLSNYHDGTAYLAMKQHIFTLIVKLAFLKTDDRFLVYPLSTLG